MAAPLPLADLLDQMMRRDHHRYTPGLLSRFSGVPKATIVNWLEGRVARPRRWHDVVRIADAMRLALPETDALLEAAGFPRVAELSLQSAPEEQILLAPWIELARAVAEPTPQRANQLPVPPTPLIGRTHELAFLHSLLHDPTVRLVTLTGTGGTGKTRLALRAATMANAIASDGVFFVDLSPLTQHELVLPTIVQTLGLRLSSGKPPLALLVEYLRQRTTLLILDNFEHVIQAAPAVASLLDAAPQLKLLITSRVVLRLYGEHEVAVPPLTLPDMRQLPPLDQLGMNESVALFVLRARAADSWFMLTNANARLIAAICARLDGLPLAIELAAARVKLLSPHGLLDRLSNRLGLLTWGARNLPLRQQTLRSTLDWSYNLLSAPQQRLFAQMAVFMAGCTLEAVESVAVGSPEAPEFVLLDELMALTDSSLVRSVVSSNGQPRYLLLETIREYAQERLEASGEAEATWQRHAVYYLKLAEQAEPALQGAQQLEWLARLEEENDNFRAVFARMLKLGDVEAAARLGSALWEFWRIRGLLREGRQWLSAILEQAEQVAPALRARILLAAGRLAREQGELPQAEQLLEAALGLLRTLDDDTRVAQVLGHLGVVAYDRGQFEHATALHSESLALRQAIGDQHGIAGTLTNLGEVARHQGNYQRSLELHQQSLAQFRLLEDPWGIAVASINLGMAAYALGSYDTAYESFAACVRLTTETGDTGSLVECLEGMALLAVAQAQAERALQLAGAAEQLRTLIEALLPAVDRENFERQLAPARTQLGARAEALRAAGRAMTLEQMVAFALQRA